MVKEMMYQSTPTVPPVGGPQTSRLQPSSTVAVKLVNQRSTLYDAPMLIPKEASNQNGFHCTMMSACASNQAFRLPDW